ncbi:MAG: helix-turn-helix domain-containing protein [Gemmatimonadales bacterium]|nr:helix-turn-helix domain-containing protein [Gemmatimonadales bacterium]
MNVDDLGPPHVEWHDRIHTNDGRPERPIGAATIVVRDRTGFEYRRDVGLDDYVSVREAAQLLQLPVMTVHRWVRTKAIKSSRRNKFTIIRLREVLRAAQERGRPLKLGSRLVIIGGSGFGEEK